MARYKRVIAPMAPRTCPSCNTRAGDSLRRVTPSHYPGYEQWMCDDCKISWFHPASKFVGKVRAMRPDLYTKAPAKTAD